MDINNILYSDKKSIKTNKIDSKLFDPNKTKKYSINSSKYKNEEEIYPTISMIHKEHIYKDEDEEEESEEKEFVINEDISRIRPSDYGYKKLIDSNISRISNRTYILDDSFEEFKDIIEMPKHLSLISKEPNLSYDNKESFTKEVDKMIQKNLNYPIKDYKLNILMVAEKPSIARTITKFLSSNKYKIYHHQSMTIFTFKGYFKNIKSYFTVTSVKGHIYENKYIYCYDENEPIESYDYDIIKVLKNSEINIPKFLRYVGKNKDILCLWIDCDPEGEQYAMKLYIMFYPI